jgi:soluble lytic murein transglycosylase
VQAATGRAHRRAREHARVLELLVPVAERCTAPELLPRVLFVLAGSEAITGDHPGAVARYRELAERFPAHPLADDALYAAGELLAAGGALEEARASLGALVREHPGGDLEDEARFQVAWLARRAGDVDEAVAALAEIEAAESGVDPYEHARAAYWRARLLAGRGEADPGASAQARAIWAELVARYPADYYGLLARARLADGEGGGGLPAPVQLAAPVEPAWSPGPLAGDPHLRAGVFLLRLGLDEDAAEELRAVDTAGLAGAGPEPLLVLADLLDRAGDHRSAHNLLRNRGRAALPRAPRAEDLRAWRIAYPPAYREVVQRYAPAAGVPTDLVQALMREESALDPRALSPVGAVGLTQLMVPTARQIARQAGSPAPSRADLMRPEVNVKLGCRYLGQLLRRFDGSLVLALAAYNAGPTPVQRWVTERGGEDLDVFVEEIPYDETRGYVKRVLRSYAAYRLLYGSPDEPSVALSLGRARVRG